MAERSALIAKESHASAMPAVAIISGSTVRMRIFVFTSFSSYSLIRWGIKVKVCMKKIENENFNPANMTRSTLLLVKIYSKYKTTKNMIFLIQNCIWTNYLIIKPPNFFTGQFSLWDKTFLSVFIISWKRVYVCHFFVFCLCNLFCVFMRGAGLPLGVVPPM